MAIIISMVMLADDCTPALDDIVGTLTSNWPNLPKATNQETKVDSILFDLGTVQVIMARMPAPIPWTDLEGPCATSILWKNAASEVKEHKFHWIVTVRGDLPPIKLSEKLTQVTAALMVSCPKAIGVYWCNATLIVPKNIFVDFAKEILPKGPPIYIWIDFRVGRDAEKTSVGFTTGLSALGLLEIETQGAPEPPGELRERLVGLAGYTIANGPVIKDGDTIGEDGDERIRVVYSKSSFGHEGQVMRLHYEKPSQKKGLWSRL